MQSSAAQPSVAILLFALSPKAEAEAKHWNLHSEELNLRVASQLISRTRQLALSTGYSLIHFDEHLQEGESFGDRFAAAFAKTYAAGFDCVVAIGSDCPGLHREDLISAAETVAAKGFAFGPSPDGGAYIVALHKAHFEARAFAALPWRQSCLYEALLHYVDASADAALSEVLPLRLDADDVHSLRLGLAAVRRYGPSVASWISVLFQYLSAVPGLKQAACPISNTSGSFHRVWQLRGPPLAVATV